MDAVASVDPSSTTAMRQLACVCANAERMVSAMVAAALNAGVMTATRKQLHESEAGQPSFLGQDDERLVYAAADRQRAGRSVHPARWQAFARI